MYILQLEHWAGGLSRVREAKKTYGTEGQASKQWLPLFHALTHSSHHHVPPLSLSLTWHSLTRTFTEPTNTPLSRASDTLTLYHLPPTSPLGYCPVLPLLYFHPLRSRLISLILLPPWTVSPLTPSTILFISPPPNNILPIPSNLSSHLLNTSHISIITLLYFSNPLLSLHSHHSPTPHLCH